MRNAALFSLLAAAAAIVGLTAGSYAEDWGPGAQGPLGYGSRDGIRQGGPNRGEDPNAIPGVGVTPGSEIPGVTPGGGLVPGGPPPGSVPPKYGKRYGKRKPPCYPPPLFPPPQQQYPPYYPPPQQQYPPYYPPPQQQYPPYYPPPQQQYPPSYPPPGYQGKDLGQMGLLEGESRRPRHGGSHSAGPLGGFTASPLGIAPSGGPQVRISPGLTFDFPDRHNGHPPRGNRHGDGGHHVPEIDIPGISTHPPHWPPHGGMEHPPQHPSPELPWLPIPHPHPNPQPPPNYHPEPPWHPTPEVPPNYIPEPPWHPDPEPEVPQVPPNHIPEPPRHPTPETPEYPPERPPQAPPEYPPVYPPQQQYPPVYPPQQQYPPTYRPPQQQGNPWGKRKSTYVYPQGTLGSTSRSGLDWPPAPIASDQRHAPNWGFDYRLEPGAYGYTALVMAVSPDAPAAQARIEPGDRITTINSRPLRGPFDVESVRGYVQFEAVNIRTGQPEWLSAVLP